MRPDTRFATWFGTTEMVVATHVCGRSPRGVIIAGREIPEIAGEALEADDDGRIGPRRIVVGIVRAKCDIVGMIGVIMPVFVEEDDPVVIVPPRTGERFGAPGEQQRAIRKKAGGSFMGGLDGSVTQARLSPIFVYRPGLSGPEFVGRLGAAGLRIKPATFPSVARVTFRS